MSLFWPVGLMVEWVPSLFVALLIVTPVNPAILTMTSANAQLNGLFGLSVASSNGHVIVGAPGETVNGLSRAGEAYVFDARTGALRLTLVSPNPELTGGFGFSVASAGDRVIVGAIDETVNGIVEAGRTHVFDVHTGARIGTLASPKAEAEGEFGYSIASSNGLVVVGAHRETVNGIVRAGRAYVFSLANGSLISTLSSPNSQGSGEFGTSVASADGRVIVGAPYESGNGFNSAGQIYVFNANTGSLLRSLVSPNAQPGGEFGISVASANGRVIVGAFFETVRGFLAAGRAYVFSAATGSVASTLVSPRTQYAGWFGFSVASSGNALIVGAPREENGLFGGAPDAITGGGAYVYDLTTNAPIATLVSPNAIFGGAFGFSVASTSGDVIVGAPVERANGVNGAGHGYVFDRTKDDAQTP